MTSLVCSVLLQLPGIKTRVGKRSSRPTAQSPSPRRSDSPKAPGTPEAAAMPQRGLPSLRPAAQNAAAPAAVVGPAELQMYVVAAAMERALQTGELSDLMNAADAVFQWHIEVRPRVALGLGWSWLTLECSTVARECALTLWYVLLALWREVNEL